MRFKGHLWTVASHLAGRLRPAQSSSSAWQQTIDDPQMGEIALRGRYHHAAHRTDRAVLLVHGLGGDPSSEYMQHAAATAAAAGYGVLRLGLRGTDLCGEDIYHAGLVEDLHAALASKALAPYTQIFIIGFSLGGHVCLRYALDPQDPRVRSVAAISTPLDLGVSADRFDVGAKIYRWHILHGLKRMYRAVAQRHDMPTPLEVVEGVQRVRDFDHYAIAPRHGFDSGEHYYQQMSVAQRLSELALPCLYIGSRADPMVPDDTVEPALKAAAGALEVRWCESGGHVAFPRDLDLGFGPKRGLIAQTLAFHETQALP